MRILICTGIYPPDSGGPATYSKLLFDELPKKGINVEVLSFGEVRYLPKLIRHIIYFKKVLEKGTKVNLIYAQDPVSVGLPAMLASKWLKKPFVLKIVGDYAWEQFQQSEVVKEYKEFISPEDFQKRGFDFKTEIRRLIQKQVAKHTDQIIVPSEYLKKIVTMWDVRPDKIQVIYNAFSLTKIVEEKYSLKTRFQISDNAVFTVGRLVPWKGFDLLVDIAKDLPQMKLFIAGDGPEEKNLKSKIEKMKLQDRVFMLGRLERGELLRRIKASDVFVLNTGYEGLSHQLLEVMSVEIPIITTNVGGNPEVVTHNKDGLLVRYNNKAELTKAITILLEDKNLSQRLTKNAKTKLEKFSKENMLDNLVKELKKVVG